MESSSHPTRFWAGTLKVDRDGIITSIASRHTGPSQGDIFTDEKGYFYFLKGGELLYLDHKGVVSKLLGKREEGCATGSVNRKSDRGNLFKSLKSDLARYCVGEIIKVAHENDCENSDTFEIAAVYVFKSDLQVMEIKRKCDY